MLDRGFGTRAAIEAVADEPNIEVSAVMLSAG
jgi:hypothetical protein